MVSPSDSESASGSRGDAVIEAAETTATDADKCIVRSGWADVRPSRLALRSTRQWLVLTDVALFIYKDRETPPRTWPLYAISDADIEYVGVSSSPFSKYPLELGSRQSGPTPARKFYFSFKSANERDHWVRSLALVRKSVLILDTPTAPTINVAEDSANTDDPGPPSLSRLDRFSSLEPPQTSYRGSSITFDTATSATGSSSRRTSYSWRGRHKRTQSDVPSRQSTVSSFVSFANTSLTSLVTIASQKSEQSRADAGGLIGLGNRSKVSLLTLDFENFQTTEELLRPSSDHSDAGPASHAPLDLTGSISKSGTWPIGGGGYADVWKGKWTANGTSRAVAIKVIRSFAMSPPSMASQAQATADQAVEKDRRIARRLQQELLIWHQLRHPHIVQLWGTATGFGPYPSFIAPWMRNGNASEWMKGQDVEQTRAKRLKLLLEVALALEFIHTRSPPIVHGDLKACNILINDSEEACLADFGLSSVISEAAGISPASLSAHVGTTRYLAFELVIPPHRASTSSSRSVSSRSSEKKASESNKDEHDDELEQARSRTENVDWNETPPCTTASDVWAFGSTAYELLSGKVPYHHRINDLQVLYEIMLSRRPQHQGTSIPLHLWSWMEQSCWAEDPKDRPDMGVVVRTMRMFVEAYRHRSQPRLPAGTRKRALPSLPTSSAPSSPTVDKGKKAVR